MATLACQITSAGIIAPSYDDILQQIKSLYFSYYGTDADLDPNTPDGQWIAVFAQAIYDCNQAMIAAYTSFSPASAQGASLSINVKINGLRRNVATNSQCVVTVTGQAGTQINNGLVGDNQNLGTQWALPAVVNIPGGGSIDVTATATTVGAIEVGAASLTQILTPTRGWQSVTNANPSTPGNPVETDAQLRKRQAASTSLPAAAIVEGMYAAIGNLPGVGRLKIYENSTNATDSNGIPAHSIAVVAEGGDAIAICTAIANKKPPGTGMAGSTSEVIVDSHGVSNTIKYYPVTEVPMAVDVTIQSLTGYTAAVGQNIIAAVVAYVNGLDIGETSYLARLYTPINLEGNGTFVVTALTQARKPNAPTAADVAIAFNEAATIVAADVQLTVT